MYIVRGSQEMAEKETERWIDMYFPYMFDDVILTNSYTPNEIHKAEICHHLGIGPVLYTHLTATTELLVVNTTRAATL